MKIGNFNPDELKEINLNGLRLIGVPEDTLTPLKAMDEFPQQTIEFLTEVRKIEEQVLKKASLSCNVQPLEERYFLICNKPIDAKGIGQVYLFYDGHTNQYVVLKLVPIREIRPAARLQREKEILTALNKLRCPYFIKVLGLGIADFSFLSESPTSIQIESDFPNINPQVANADELPCYDRQDFVNPEHVHIFLVMPYIQGKTLETYCLTDGPQYKNYSKDKSLLELLKIILQAIRKIASALEKIHTLGIVHRNIQPNHIIMQSDDHPVLIDFSIAQRQDIEGEHRTHYTISDGLGNPGYRDPCTSQYETKMHELQEQIKKMIDEMSMDAGHWKMIVQASESICANFPFKTQRLVQKIKQYQRGLRWQRWFHPKQWKKNPSITAQQWHELEILVEELQRCSHPYEDVFSLGATLYWCLTKNAVTDTSDTSDIYRYLSSPVEVEIKLPPSLFGVNTTGKAGEQVNPLQTKLTKIEKALSALITQMLQHPPEKRCSLKTVQQVLNSIITMLPKK